MYEYVSFCLHPKIYLNCLYQKVNLHLYTGCVCCLLETIIWITKVLFMKETSKSRFLTRREERKMREHSDVKSANFQKDYFYIKINLFVLFFLVHIFVIFQNTSVLTVSESNTCWRKVRN